MLGNKAGAAIANIGVNGGVCVPTSVAASENTTCMVMNFVAPSAAGNSFDQANVVVSYTDARTGVQHADTLFVKGKYE